MCQLKTPRRFCQLTGDSVDCFMTRGYLTGKSLRTPAVKNDLKCQVTLAVCSCVEKLLPWCTAIVYDH